MINLATARPAFVTTRPAGREAKTLTGAQVDRRLMLQVQRRDRAALEKLFDRHASKAVGLAYKILRDRDLAEEVAQEAFWRVWDRAGQFDSLRGNFGSWLMGIVRHLAIDELRRRAARPAPEEADVLEFHMSQDAPESANVVDLVAHRLRAEDVRAAIAALPAAQREVIELAFFEGLTRQEISDHLKEPLGTIHTRARLGLEKLRRLLTNE